METGAIAKLLFIAAILLVSIDENSVMGNVLQPEPRVDGTNLHRDLEVNSSTDWSDEFSKEFSRMADDTSEEQDPYPSPTQDIYWMPPPMCRCKINAFGYCDSICPPKLFPVVRNNCVFDVNGKCVGTCKCQKWLWPYYTPDH